MKKALRSIALVGTLAGLLAGCKADSRDIMGLEGLERSSLSANLVEGQPNADVDCSTEVTDPYGILGTGTRAEIYGCKPIGNSGEEQGVYTLSGPATLFGYTADYGICNILVKWSGDFGGTPYLDFGRVYNLAKCTNGFLEVWGDRFSATDGFGDTPYVWSIKGSGSQIHGPN